MTAILNPTGPAPHAAPAPNAAPAPPERAPAPPERTPAPPERAPAPVERAPAGRSDPAQPPAATRLPVAEWSAPAGSTSWSALSLPGPRPGVLLPVAAGGRPVGAFIVVDGALRYRPVVDLRALVGAAAGAIGALAVAVSVATAARRPPAVGSVRMGPGGWVSLRGVPAPVLRPAPSRPWWARLLRAHPLDGRR
ncbi:hypothetical protein ACFFWC_20010 [Plantactinospora siamensis]|uniref:Uncharacterized protein n=1 Tax=Plantactinospora siamensis TaxID=555372 RepID=A0ABV6P2Q5_9ACTN